MQRQTLTAALISLREGKEFEKAEAGSDQQKQNPVRYRSIDAGFWLVRNRYQLTYTVTKNQD